MLQNRLELATPQVCYNIGCIHISELFFCFVFAFPKLNFFLLPLHWKIIAFSKIKLLFVTPSFENNCFFHKFNCLNTPKSGLSVPLGCVSYMQRYVHEVLANPLVKLDQEKFN